MSEERVKEAEETPVDDVRRVRERLGREVGGDLRKLAQRSNDAYDALRQRLESQGHGETQMSGR